MNTLDNLSQWGYSGLFLASFLAATILPLGSEVVFIACISMGLNPYWCLLVATIGNTLGGMTNYILGRLGKIEWIEKYLKVPLSKIENTQKLIQGGGTIISFFSFLPVVGDLIPLALGYMRSNPYLVTLFMLIGKALRYYLIIKGYDSIVK